MVPVYSLPHPDYPFRINYYSTPDATVRVSGQPVGEANLSDNRGVMEASAISFQHIGDESMACPTGRTVYVKKPLNKGKFIVYKL